MLAEVMLSLLLTQLLFLSCSQLLPMGSAVGSRNARLLRGCAHCDQVPGHGNALLMGCAAWREQTGAGFSR